MQPPEMLDQRLASSYRRLMLKGVMLAGLLVLTWFCACANKNAPANPGTAAASTASALPIDAGVAAFDANVDAPSPRRSLRADSDDAVFFKQCFRPDAGLLPPSRGEDLCAEDATCSTTHDCRNSATCDCGCCRESRGRSLAASDQSPVSPSGHEFLTLESALRTQRLVNDFPGEEGADEIAQRGRCSGACQHSAASYRVWSAVMGARWADLMGFRAGPFFPAQQRCLLAVAQDNDDVQYDHALRKASEKGPAGGIIALEGIRDRLVRRFVDAVLAGDVDIDIADGGAEQDHDRASRAYFLLGRALHIVQDSFSTFHGTRQSPDYRRVVQVNSYVCTPNAPVHPHVTPGVANLFFGPDYTNGDVIWRSDCDGERAECLKSEYAAAVEASRDLWVAFWRAHTAPPQEQADAARRYIQTFLDHWMAVPESMPDAGAPKGCPLQELLNIDRRRSACLAMTGSQTGEVAPPFDWDRKHFSGIP